MINQLKIHNAHKNNLKNVSLSLNYGGLTVFAGVSGSGKSSLVFDTLYKYATNKNAEVNVDEITGIPRVIRCVEQKVRNKNFYKETTVAKYMNIKCSDDTLQKAYPNQYAAQILRQLNLGNIQISSPLKNLSSGQLRLLDIFMAINDLKEKSLVIIDEPDACLLKEEIDTVAEILTFLAKQGHMILIVAHRRDMIKYADRVIAFGPGSGADGGKIIYDGDPNKYILGLADVAISKPKNINSKKNIAVHFSDFRGIKNYKISMPLNKLTAVSGKTGSGKTRSLDAIFIACDKSEGAGSRRADNAFVKITGKQHIRRPHIITDEPVGKNKNSTVSTYYDIWKQIGDIAKKMDIENIKKLTVKEAIDAFSNVKYLHRKLNFLADIGLDYLVLTQSTSTLSGGESQRIKIAKILCKKLGSRSLYILDNPCRGLGEANIPQVMQTLQEIVKNNNSVLIAENNPYALHMVNEVIRLL